MSDSEPIAAPRTPRRLTPVPMPFSVRWKEFRVTALPLLVFVGGALTAVFLWKHAGMASGIAGIGEGARSLVTAAQPSIIQRILVQPYQFVNAGDPIAIIQPVDPRMQMDLLQSEVGLTRLQWQPSLAEENAMNFEQIRVDLLRTKSELGIAKVNLARAENQVRRNEPLYKEKLVSEDTYDLSVKTRDMFAVEVLETSNAVAQIEKRLEELTTLGVPQTGNTNSLMSADLPRLNALRAALATNLQPLTLFAPISGMVTSITRHGGESVVEGEPFLTIGSPYSERVVGYLRQPYSIEPSIGQEVVMTTRERRPRKLMGTVTQIGAQVELITNALAFVRQGSLVDAGLPVIVSVPPGVQVRPGEIVDLTFRTAPARDSGSPASSSESARARSRNQLSVIP